MNLHTHSELDSLTEPASARLAARRPAALRIAAKSLVKVNVISIISNILLIGNSG
jgi:hypothetical protein